MVARYVEALDISRTNAGSPRNDKIKACGGETLNAIVKGLPIPRPGIPESFKVLMRELQALCLDVATYKLDVQQDKSLKEYEINLMSENNDNLEGIANLESIKRISTTEQMPKIL